MIKTAPRVPLTRADYFRLYGEPQGETRELMLANADRTIFRINAMLVYAWRDGVDIGIDQVSGNPFASGYRPAGVNARTQNAVSGSKHLTCEAGDVQDLDDRRFAVWCCTHQDLLATCELWMEDPRWTGGRINTDPWGHLQTRPASKRIYIPYADLVAHPATDPHFFTSRALAMPS